MVSCRMHAPAVPELTRLATYFNPNDRKRWVETEPGQLDPAQCKHTAKHVPNCLFLTGPLATAPRGARLLGLESFTKAFSSMFYLNISNPPPPPTPPPSVSVEGASLEQPGSETQLTLPWKGQLSPHMQAGPFAH